ncbi:hypothetical protein [Kineococcus rhizosphaerae]|uniref:Uncharacterized protein n=1 Tax=Kineococcus rhizosphaerae TaxID=559628 RepID=A0A2T0QWT2_9ACTN|nr:hypothetical protein [Kineococcus rhizosphaerae]PRY09928.1 hypothetical protein CLV37_11936 [Kineococcus rhizosphaerae]
MSGPQSANSEPDERMQVTLIAMAVASAVGVTAMWKAVLTFLIGFAVLVPAGADVLVRMPGGAGVGLDAPRCWIAAALVMALVGLGVKHQRHRRQLESL